MRKIKVTDKNKSEMMRKYKFVRIYNNYGSIYALPKNYKSNYANYDTRIGFVLRKTGSLFLITKIYKRIKNGKYFLIT